MAYNLQAFKRSFKFIGEGNDATAGRATPYAETKFICEEILGEKWWFLAVPSCTAVHAVTGENWERVDVRSNIAAGKGEWEDVSDAGEVARRLAKALLEPRTEL